MPATTARRKPGRPKTDDPCHRGVFDGAVLRAGSIDEENRSAEFVAATENGVDTFMGKEFLRMKGMRLDRFRSNPVVLDAHNRWESGAVIGNALVKVVKRELIATITFAETERAETVWTLVRTGFLRAVSVGFIPNRLEIVELKDGQKDGRGEAQISGPARIIKQSELFEISVVPVPADAAAVRRYLEDSGAPLAPQESRTSGKEESMDPKFEAWLAERGFTDTESLSTEQLKALERDFKASVKPPAPEATPVVPAPDDEKKRELTALELVKRDVLAICPQGMEATVDALLLEEGMDVAKARKRFKDDLTKRQEAAGTPEPPDTETRNNKGDDGKKKVEALSERDITSVIGV